MTRTRVEETLPWHAFALSGFISGWACAGVGGRRVEFTLHWVFGGMVFLMSLTLRLLGEVSTLRPRTSLRDALLVVLNDLHSARISAGG